MAALLTAVFYTAGEADREIAAHCRREGYAAVLGKDSDFFVLDVPVYLVLDTLRLDTSPPICAAYQREDVLNVLGLTNPMVPLFASLVGNDFVDPSILQPLHTAMRAEATRRAAAAELSGDGEKQASVYGRYRRYKTSQTLYGHRDRCI